jgi:hypothetical protein
METNHLRGIRRRLEITVNGVLDHDPKIFQVFPLGLDAVAQRLRVESAIDLVLPDFENNLLHLLILVEPDEINRILRSTDCIF